MTDRVRQQAYSTPFHGNRRFGSVLLFEEFVARNAIS